jgi:hypothetical protein
MKWITRKELRAEGIACTWLIRRFLDEDAEFIFAEENEVLNVAAREEAVPFGLPRHPELKFTAKGGLSTFEVLLDESELEDRGLTRLAKILSAAELRGEESAAPQGAGLKAIVDGFALMGASDEQRLTWGFPIFDALYAWCQKHPK